MKFDQDVIAELGRLPATLKESYDIIYQMISESGPISRIMAKKIFTWLLCAQRPLRSRELVAAVTVDSNGLLLSSTNDDILDVCCNIVILDTELDIFRFAHLSVREYLEGRADYAASEMHTIVLERCLDVCVDQRRRDSLQPFTVEQHEILRPYSATYWPLHLHLLEDYDLAENLKEKVIRFLFDRSGTSAAFQDWLGIAQELAANLSYLHPLKAMLKASLSDPPTPLFVACSFGLMSVLKSLSTYDNIDWNKGNISEHRGLHLAVLYKHVTVVRFLLEQNVDTQGIQDGAGLTPLFLAAQSGAKGIVQLLLEHESEVQPTYSSGYLPLHVAALEGRYEAVESLLNHGANVDARYPEHALVFGLPEPQTVALHNAAERGHEAVVRLLLEHDADIEAKNPLGTTALHDAADYGHTEALKTLLEYGARTDVRDEFGNTPLHGATLNGNEKAVRLLLENNADIEMRNDLGARALDIAVRSTNARLVQTLLEYGAKVDAKDRKSNTALHRASLSGQEDAIRLLLENNADPLERNNDGQSPEDLLAKPEMREWYSNIYRREAFEG
jgi:ankyrin repeat protein